MISIRKFISCGYILIFILIGMIIYCYQYEWKKLEVLEKENRTTDELRRYVNELNFRLTGFSLLGETILEWEDKDIANYHCSVWLWIVCFIISRLSTRLNALTVYAIF